MRIKFITGLLQSAKTKKYSLTFIPMNKLQLLNYQTSQKDKINNWKLNINIII